MQKWKVFEDRWHPVKDDEGRHYLVSEVDAALAVKDRVISRLRSDLCDANIRYENALILCKERQEQIATLKANAEFLSSELERLRSRVVLTPAESHLTMPAALEEGEEG